MTLYIDQTRIVKPVRQKTIWRDERWKQYFVYRVSDLKKTFKGYSLKDIFYSFFSWGNNGPGMEYSRKPSFRKMAKGKFLVVVQFGGLDI